MQQLKKNHLSETQCFSDQKSLKLPSRYSCYVRNTQDHDTNSEQQPHVLFIIRLNSYTPSFCFSVLELQKAPHHRHRQAPLHCQACIALHKTASTGLSTKLNHWPEGQQTGKKPPPHEQTRSQEQRMLVIMLPHCHVAGQAHHKDVIIASPTFFPWHWGWLQYHTTIRDAVLACPQPASQPASAFDVAIRFTEAALSAASAIMRHSVHVFTDKPHAPAKFLVVGWTVHLTSTHEPAQIMCILPSICQHATVGTVHFSCVRKQKKR